MAQLSWRHYNSHVCLHNILGLLAGQAAHFLYQDSAPDLRKLCRACHRSPARRRAAQRQRRRGGPTCPDKVLRPDGRTGARHPALSVVLVLCKAAVCWEALTATCPRCGVAATLHIAWCFSGRSTTGTDMTCCRAVLAALPARQTGSQPDRGAATRPRPSGMADRPSLSKKH
jgi:hypothetical protein